MPWLSTTTMISYTISHTAYLKLALHASKYPHRAVTGLLLGRDAGSGAVEIVDAVPLVHRWTSLSLATGVGLEMTRSYVQSPSFPSPLQLVGIYHTPEHEDKSITDPDASARLPPVLETLGAEVKSGFTLAVALVIDGTKLAAGEPALIPYLPNDASPVPSWRPAVSRTDVRPFSAPSHFKLARSGTPRRVLELLRGPDGMSLLKKIGDFDDHLEDVNVDWLRNEACADADWEK